MYYSRYYGSYTVAEDNRKCKCKECFLRDICAHAPLTMCMYFHCTAE